MRQNQKVKKRFRSGKGDGTYLFSSLTYFATCLPSCGCIVAEGFDNNSIVRNVGVRGPRKNGCEAESRGVVGVQKWIE